MVRLTLLGGATVEGPDGPLDGRIVQRRQLAVLAYLAVEGRATRDKLIGVFWPEMPEARARHTLSDTLYVIRAALGEGAVRVNGEEVQLDSAIVSSDVRTFRAALTMDPERAVSIYRGDFLDGFHLGNAPAFEHWQERERSALVRQCLAALQTLIDAADGLSAVRWWRRAATLDPHSSRIALGLARALDANGDPAGAMRVLATHETLLKEGLGLEPPAAHREFADALQNARPVRSTTTKPPAGETAVPGAPAPGQPERSADTPSFDRRPILAGIGIVAVFLAFVVPGVRSPTPAIDEQRVAILPFRVASADSGLAYLRNGMVELLAIKLSGDDEALHAVPPADLLTAHRNAAPRTEREGLALTRALGAGLMIDGAVVGTPTALTLQVRMLAVAGEERARAEASGSAEELPSLIDRLVAELLSRDAGVADERLAHLTSRSLPALRAYLTGLEAHRNGDYAQALRAYAHAMELDTTFALAGMGARSASGWVGGSAPVARLAGQVALRHADRLSPRDRVGLLGRLDRERTQPVTARLRRNERVEALRVYPDHAQLWYSLGEVYFHNGAAIGVEGPMRQARHAFERALELDPRYADAIHHMAATLTVLGDTAALRQFTTTQLDRIPPGQIADYLRWNAARALEDPSFDPPALAEMDVDVTLRWIGLVTQDGGLAVSDGEEAVRLRADRPGIRDEVLERRLGAWAWHVNGGRPTDATRALRSIAEVAPDPDYVHRLAILSARYADGDTVEAGRAAARLAASRADGVRADLNRCIADLWRLRDIHEAIAPPRLLSDQEAVSGDSWPLPVPRRLCDLVRGAEWLARAGGPAADSAIARLDSLLAMGPILGLVDDGQEEWVHIALARLHAAGGRPADALRALRRRAFYAGWQPWLAAMLREEGRLALEVGDTAGAIRAYLHVLAFRNDPEPALAIETGQIEATLRGMMR